MRSAFCGGSTPKRLYQLLAASPLREAMPWERVHLFWGDDRFVAWDDPNSNYAMARDAMIAHVPIPPENVHGIEHQGSPADAARTYEQVLKSYYGGDTLDPATRTVKARGAVDNPNRLLKAEMYVEVEVTGSRASSQPGRGVVTARNLVRNQHGDVVMEYNPVRLIRGDDFG